MHIGPWGIDGHVTNMSGHAVRPAHDLAVHQHGAAHTGSQREHQHVLATLGRSPEPFGDQRGARVVIGIHGFAGGCLRSPVRAMNVLPDASDRPGERTNIVVLVSTTPLHPMPTARTAALELSLAKNDSASASETLDGSRRSVRTAQTAGALSHPPTRL